MARDTRLPMAKQSATPPPLPPSFFCRALYDYEALDAATLSFRKGDIIEVLGGEQWWDGLLGDQRGWFPSNYVAVISDEEADLALASPAASASNTPTSYYSHEKDDGSMLDLSYALMRGITEKEDWLDADIAPGGIEGLAKAALIDDGHEASDFWMPEVTSSGQIYYVNTETGQRSLDLPHESEGNMEDALGLKACMPAKSFYSKGEVASMASRRSGSITSTRRSESIDSRENGGRSTNPSLSKSPQQPRCLPTACNPDEIMVDPDGSVRAGTLPALIEHLTAHDKQDPAFFRRFLTTFKSFTTVDQLFDLLVQRFRIQPPWKLTQGEREEWYKLTQVVQIRVLNTFKYMVLEDGVLEKDELYILDSLKEFLATDEGGRFAVGKQLSILIQRRQLQGCSMDINVALEQMPPPPLVPKSSHELRILDIEAIELARQLTIMESQMYQRIRPVDCLQRAREQRSDYIDNITTVIQTSNKIALWIAESILSKGDPRRRVRAIERIISVADHCRRLSNFSTMTSIIAGLNTPPIRRLKRTWDQVSKRYLAQFDVCERLVSSRKGFSEYRTLIKSAHPPWLPFFGIFLSTLQFIHEGHQDNIPMPGVVGATLVNFLKRQRLSDVITDLKRWQVPFNLEVVPSIQVYIDKSLSSVGDTQESTERFWATSLELEPRDPQDEKMARLLLESGFL